MDDENYKMISCDFVGDGWSKYESETIRKHP